FDCTTSNQSNSSGSTSSADSEYHNVAILSPHLDLPSFLLITRISAPGPFGGMLDSLIASGATRAGFIEWQSVPPDFDLKYMLYIKENPRVEKVFTEQVLSSIAKTEHVVARGNGRLLVFNHFDSRRGGKVEANVLADLIQQARQFCDWLAS
ncbi:MAG: hypothetical protein NTZ48_04140, partial [Candidatus Omnitrophica bacterium]|nr:hypothetical protein [Candidatus Omnitrophota bacterium]